jgi:DNA gyrase subunit A
VADGVPAASATAGRSQSGDTTGHGALGGGAADHEAAVNGASAGVTEQEATPPEPPGGSQPGPDQTGRGFEWAPGEAVIALFDLDLDAPALAIGTRHGTVKRVVPEYRDWETWEMIGLKDGDRVIGAAPAADADDLVFITTDAQLLRLPARSVRPQGRAAGGMAGIKLGPEATVLAFTAIGRGLKETALVATVATGAEGPDSAKVTPFSAFPAKGRATGGVRCQRFTKGQDHLVLGWAGPPPALACGAEGFPRTLPAIEPRRDATGTALGASLFALGSGFILAPSP